MKTKLTLITTKCLFVTALFLTVSFSTYSQQIKGTNTKAKSAYQLYKQAKIYDSQKKKSSQNKPESVGDRAIDRINYEYSLLKNPYTGKVPENISKAEIKFSNGLPKSEKFESKKNSSKGGNYWVNRGPYNVGGRTRALAIDLEDENVIIAGGITGGVWRSINGGETWRKVTKREQDPSVTAIVQDPRPGHRNVWYFSSGEFLGNSASVNTLFSGTGIYKSTDRGRTWNILPSTFNRDNNIGTITPYEIVNSIAINPINGDLYLATISGIYRSDNGGDSFTEVLDSDFFNSTEVIATPDGTIYVTIASGRVSRGRLIENANKGFYKTTDGVTWENITPNITFYGRTVMANNPTNNNEVYFFSHNYSDVNRPLLAKYNASSTNEKWKNLSDNLPINIGGSVGNLDLQGGYNMLIKVKPDNPNFIVVGGTNLYRSTTGFTTPTGSEGWIGGYSPLNNISTYSDHHSDQHNLIFYPSNPNKVLTGNDGGVQVTNDITSTLDPVEPVDWVSLSNGYLTTQAYTIAFNPKGKYYHKGSMDLLAGFQDNGTWFTNSRNGQDPWQQDFSGDGSYNAIADNGRTRYVSYQNGNVVRFDFDESGEPNSFTWITPTIKTNPRFINPFILDPINDNIMYMLDGNRILRNNNLDEIPNTDNSNARTTSVNWIAMDKTKTSDNSNITALDVSIYPKASRLYYGTDSGGVYRMDNANLDNQEAIDISTGKGLPEGYVINIAADPSNSDSAILVFSNYGIPSLFHTTDAGETWTNISSNLEENPDGSGNGPSIRWAAFFGNGESYLVATSTGLYSTSKLEGSKTRWSNESRIGNNIVTQVKTRRDGFMAVATHGNGLFSARFAIFRQFQVPKPTLSVSRLLPDFLVLENSSDTTIDITDLFVSSNNSPISIEITSSNPNLVTASIEDNKLIVKYANEEGGNATIGLIATSGEETVSEGFTINVLEESLYEQVDQTVASSASQFFLDFNGLIQSADDFIVPEGNIWSINKVIAFGSVGGAPVLNNATVVIYKDENGKPGEEVFNSGNIVPISEANDSNLNLILPQEVQLEGGKYWLSVYENLAFDGGNQWFWSNQDIVSGTESQFKDNQNLLGTGAVDWTPSSSVFNRASTDQKFQLFGIVSNAIEEAVLTTIDANFTTMAWPNPSTDKFNFHLESFKVDKVSIKVFNLSGQLIFEKNGLSTQKNFTWNASNVPAGIYLVHIKGSDINYKGKLIKN